MAKDHFTPIGKQNHSVFDKPDMDSMFGFELKVCFAKKGFIQLKSPLVRVCSKHISLNLRARLKFFKLSLRPDPCSF